MEGRDFIKDNVVWQVMRGHEVFIWRDKWVLGLGGQKLTKLGLVDDDILEKVVEIID